MGVEQPGRKKPGGKRTTKNVADEFRVEQRREQVAELKAAGWTIRAIAEHLGCGVATVQRDVDASLERAIAASTRSIEKARTLALLRLDIATKAIWEDVKEGNLEAIDRLVKIEGRRAKLEGTNAPVLKEVTQTVATIELDDLEELRKNAEANEATACSPTASPSDENAPSS